MIEPDNPAARHAQRVEIQASLLRTEIISRSQDFFGFNLGARVIDYALVERPSDVEGYARKETQLLDSLTRTAFDVLQAGLLETASDMEQERAAHALAAVQVASEERATYLRAKLAIGAKVAALEHNGAYDHPEEPTPGYGGGWDNPANIAGGTVDSFHG